MSKRGHLILFSLLIVFGLPVVSSWFLLWNPDFLPESRANRGRLISPPVATPLTGSWTLLVPEKEGCDADCKRVRTVVTVVMRALGAQGRHVKGPADCSTAETRKICAAVLAGVSSGTGLVIVDPMGNAMMAYDSNVAPRDLLKDVQRLVKVSRHWRFDGHQ